MDSIALSTAAFCLWDIPPKQKLTHCHGLGFKDIEIALSTERMVRDFLSFLEGSPDIPPFREITLHAPWHRVTYGDSPATRKLFESLNRIMKRLGVKRIIVHQERVTDPAVLCWLDAAVSLENGADFGECRSLEAALEAHGYKLALNLNKASRKPQLLHRLLNSHGDRIERVHLSGFKPGAGRMPLLDADQLYLLSAVSELQTQWVLEGLFTPGNLRSILNERSRVSEIIGYSRECALASEAG